LHKIERSDLLDVLEMYPDFAQDFEKKFQVTFDLRECEMTDQKPINRKRFKTIKSLEATNLAYKRSPKETHKNRVSLSASGILDTYEQPDTTSAIREYPGLSVLKKNSLADFTLSLLESTSGHLTGLSNQNQLQTSAKINLNNTGKPSFEYSLI
jgi:hypothetical protein